VDLISKKKRRENERKKETNEVKMNEKLYKNFKRK